MTTQQYKLHYFNMRNRAEPIRVLLHFTNQPYEEELYTFAQWPAVKPPGNALSYASESGSNAGSYPVERTSA